MKVKALLERESAGRLWVTLIVRVVAPADVTVIVPVLEALVVFCLALILNEPLPV